MRKVALLPPGPSADSFATPSSCGAGFAGRAFDQTDESEGGHATQDNGRFDWDLMNAWFLP